MCIFEECSRIKTSGKGQIHVLIYGLCSFDISVEERQFSLLRGRKESCAKAAAVSVKQSPGINFLPGLDCGQRGPSGLWQMKADKQ